MCTRKGGGGGGEEGRKLTVNMKCIAAWNGGDYVEKRNWLDTCVYSGLFSRRFSIILEVVGGNENFLDFLFRYREKYRSI